MTIHEKGLLEYTSDHSRLLWSVTVDCSCHIYHSVGMTETSSVSTPVPCQSQRTLDGLTDFATIGSFAANSGDRYSSIVRWAGLESLQC